MKRIYMLGMILMAGQIATAQVSHDFRMERSEFVKMKVETNLLRGTLDEMEGVSFPIGFDFEFSNGLIVDHLRFTGDGQLEAYCEDGRTTIFELGPVMQVDLVDRAGIGSKSSSVSYAINGNPGKRELVVDWNNVGFQKELDEYGTTHDFANFQLVLSERGDKISYIYGDSRINHPRSYFGERGPLVGLTSRKFDEYIFLTGQGNNPEASEEETNLSYFPPSRAKFVFKSNVVEELEEIEEDKLAKVVTLDAKIYPNPCLDHFKIKLARGVSNAIVQVLNPYGKVMYKATVNDHATIDLTGYDQGLYTVRISTPYSSIARKVMKM